MKRPDFSGKRILVIGAARSGVAVTEFMLKKAARPLLYDAKPLDRLADAEKIRELAAAGAELALGGEAPGVDFDLIVMSPGVPLKIPAVQDAVAAGVPLWGELELAWRFADAPFVAITGTNGKTTTTALTGEIFRAAGGSVFVGGNIGVALTQAVEDVPADGVIVSEVSSFQLETVHEFRPRAAAILNFEPDHLDRHGSFEAYMEAKCQIFARQGKEDWLILNYDDERVRALAGRAPGRVCFFSRREVLPQGVFVEDGMICIRLDGEKRNLLPADGIYIKGGHNLENALAAAALAAVMGVPDAVIAKTLAEFRGVEHRLEWVCKENGVDFVNDSKGTNPASTVKALESYTEPIVLIAGGYDKHADFSGIAPLMARKCRHIVLLGQTKEKLAAALSAQGFSALHIVRDMAEAVETARGLAQPGDVVLLSPACASWDMYPDFEARGREFKRLVKHEE